jgi:hypothetical protein
MTDMEIRIRLSCYAEELREIQMRLVALTMNTSNSDLITEMDTCEVELAIVAKALEIMSRPGYVPDRPVDEKAIEAIENQ